VTRPAGGKVCPDPVWPWSDERTTGVDIKIPTRSHHGANAAAVTPLRLQVGHGKKKGQAHSTKRDCSRPIRASRVRLVADLFTCRFEPTDIAFLGGVVNYLLSEDKIQAQYSGPTPT